MLVSFFFLVVFLWMRPYRRSVHNSLQAGFMCVPIVALGWALCGGWEATEVQLLGATGDKFGDAAIVGLHLCVLIVPVIMGVCCFAWFLYIFCKYRVSKEVAAIKRIVSSSVQPKDDDEGEKGDEPEAEKKESVEVEKKESVEADEKNKESVDEQRDAEPTAAGPSTEAAAEDGAGEKSEKKSNVKSKKKKKGTRQRRDWLKDENSDDSHEDWSSWSSWDPGVSDGAGDILSIVTGT